MCWSNEDPDTFTELLYTTRRWNKVPNQLLEMVMENERGQFGRSVPDPAG
jgi:hypothetical protein